MTMIQKNPSIMKSKSEPNYYFSAYPLKALNIPETEKKSNYLHIVTRPGNRKKYAESANVLPMKNPYPEKTPPNIPDKKFSQKQSDHIDHRDSDWFASYE